MPTQNPYSDKLHGALKEAYGDSFSLTEEQFLEKMNSDVAYRDKIYGAFQEAYGDGFTLTPEQFAEKLKKKGVSGQGSDPLTQPLPVKTVPAKVAPKGQATNVKPAPQKQAPAGMQGDPFANQQVPASVGYDARLVRESIKGVKEGLDKTYRIAQEGKRKGFFDSWNTQQAYSYIKPSVDYTEQMLDKIKNIQDPEIQALYTELKNANTQMKDMVGQAWNDGWDESSVNQYIGGLNRQISTKLDEVDRRMAQLQQPTEQEKKTQETFQKAKLAPSKKEALPAKTEQQIKEEEELAAMPKTVGLPTEEELKAREEESTYPEKRKQLKAAFEATPWLKSTYGDFENFELSNDIEKAVQQGEDVAALFNEKATQKSIKAQAEALEATMGQRHKDVNFSAYQENFNQLYDAWNKSWSEDPESEESKTLSKDLREAESAMNEAYKNLDLDYLESMKATQPTLATENIDRYNKISQRLAAGEEVGDSEMQFLYDTRKQALTAYGVMENAKLIKLKENADIPGYTKMMAEITPLFQEVLGQQDLVKYASEQQMKQAKATMAPIQEEYGKKRRELSDYESQLKDIDAQLAQLDAEYQLGMKTQQEYEYGFDQLSSARNNVYGLYSTTYSALEELNKAMETAIAPFNTEISKIQDPYNKKIAELNKAIADIKKKTGVDDSVLAQLDIAYKNIATVDLGIKTTNAQFSKQNYSEELNKMLEKQRKEDGSIVGEMVRGFTSGMANIALGAMKLPKGIGLEDSSEYGFVDKLYYDAMQLQKEASGTWGGLTGDDVPFWLDQAYGIANGVASTYTYAMGGAIPISSLATSAATTFVLSAGDNYQRAIDAGFDTGEAQIFSNLMTLAQAGAEMIYNDVNVFDDVVGNTILRNVTKNGLTLKQAAKVAFQQLPKNAAKMSKAVKMELLEEGTSLMADKLVLNTTNTMAGKKYFEDATLSTKEVEETFITTAGSTIITRMIGRRSKLDPNSRMALFKSVEDSQKILDNAERNNLDKSKIAEIKKTLDEAKLKLSVVESHTNWSRMTDEQKAYAFDVARQLELNEKAVKSNAQNGIQDESLNQQTEELRQELNDALNNPEAVQQQEKTKSNTLEVLEAIKNGEDYTQMVSQHPNWNSLSDAEKKEIESLSEDLEEKQREILSLFEVGVESSSTIEQRDAIENKIAEILNKPKNDQKDIQGVSGEVREGKEPIQAEPVATEGEGETEAGGVLQAPGQEEVTPTAEADDEAVLQAQEEIEARRKQELKENEDRLDDDYMAGSTETIGERINAKYDAELAALGEASEAKKKPIATTGAAPEAAAETEEVSPEIAKIEEQRAAELEAFENDENLTEIDGEQVLLTPDGRITSDTINKKYDKRVNFQKEIEAAVAEVKKQQNPEYQAALREAIDADPQATTEVHQMAAENILNGAKAADAIATAKQEATQKARAEKARQAMEREGIVSSKEDIRKAIANVTRALRSTGIRVRDPLPPKQFEEERKKAKASDTAEGWFRSKTGEIIFSEKALEEGWGTTIVFHEGTHPILNIIRNTDKKLYDRAVQGLREAAKKEKLNGKPNPLKDVEAWVAKAAGKKTQEQQDDEFMTETIARLASGDIEIKRLPLTLRDKLIEFLNKMAKFMGFKRVFLNSPDYEFRRLANQIATTLAKGERIEKVVGKRNVKKYGAKFIQPRAIELLMGKENLSKYGLEPGKKYNVRQIYEAFEKRQKDLFGQIDRKDYSDKTMKQLAEWAKDEVMFMMTQFPEESGTGWYTTKFQAALDEVAKIFPEIGTDPGQRSLFTMLVAIYSDGTKVEKNMSNAIMAYSDYRKTGVIPNTDSGGERNASFNANINEINRLIAEFDGDFEAMTKYLLEEKSGSELAKEAKENGEEFKTDWPAEMILPVASRVFGPKLGMFYSNLMGKEGYPTLDRWFSRLFNRYRGDLMPRLTGLKGKEKDTKGELQGVARFKSFIGKPGISDNKAIEEAKERALKFGSRTKLGDAAKASKMLSPIEKKLGMKQGADKASKEKFKKAAKAAGIKLTGPEFKAHEQFVKDRTGGFWTELEGKVGFKQGSKDTDKTRFDEAAAKLGYGPDSKLYKNHLADKAANTIYKAAFVALNDAPFNRTDRKFMFDTLVEARKMLKKEGVDVTVADIQAILWYYEKKLYVSQGGLESAMGISYQEAAENSVEEYKRNGGVLDTEVTEEDLIDEEGETDLEDEFVQPSEKAGRGARGKQDLVEGTYYQSGLTEDKNDYVFFHVSSAPEASIRKGIDSTKYTSLRTSREEKGLQYGVASYYTRPEDGERMVGGEKYAVRVPKNKVYPIDSDPNGYSEQAEANIPQGTPFRAEAVKREIADMAKKDGYQMIVGEWSYSRTGKPAGELPEFRADALVPLKPTKEKPDSFTSNAEKGMERIPFPGQQSEEAKQELGNLASEVRDIMSAKKKFSSKEYSLADDVYMNGQVRENKYEDDEFSRDITPEEYDMMTKVLPKSMQAEVARVRELLFGTKVQESVNIPRGVKQFANNVSSTIDRIKNATGEDGATLNLDGTTYEDGGLVVPAGSFNVSQDAVSAEGLFEFLKDNEGNISSNIFKIGLYRFPDRPEVSYDLNIVIPRQYRDVALAFGKLAGQESLFDLDTFENIKTGADGKNPRKFTAQELAEIAKDLSEGRIPKIMEPKGNKRVAKAMGIDDTIQPSDMGRGERVTGYRGLPGKYVQDYNGIQYFAENEKYAGVFGKNIVKANISKNKILDLAKWNKKLKDAGIPDNGMGQPFLTIDQSMFDENRNFTTKGREGTFGKMKRAIGLDEFNKFKEEFDNAEVIYGEDAGNVGEMVYAVRDPKAIDLTGEEIIQPSLPGRFDKNDIPDLIQRSIAGIGADLNKGMSLLEAIENNVTSQDWYPLLSDKEKRQFQSVIESAFEEEVAGIPSEQEEAAEIGVDPNTRQVASELEDLYYETRDGNRRQRNQAESRRNEIFRGNPKLSYIYKNFDLLSAQLEERGLLTKSIGCP